MFWYEIILLILAGIIVLGFGGAVLSILLLVAKPPRFQDEFTRSYERKIHHVDFSDYDVRWKREPFSLPMNGFFMQGETIINPVSNKEQNKVVIICHGQTMNRLSCIKYGQIFYRLGYHLVIFDARYFGKSVFPFSSLGYFEQKDLLALIQFTKKRFGENAFIGLHGESMGAATALLSSEHSPNIRFIVADCPFSNLDRLCRYAVHHRLHLPGLLIVRIANQITKMLWHFDYRQVSPFDSVRRTNIPICFIHGKKDSFIPSSMSEEMFHQCQNPDSELHLVEGATHAQSYLQDSMKYEKMVDDFVHKIENRNEK